MAATSTPSSALLAGTLLIAIGTVAAPAVAQEDEVRIEKATEGQDADSPPGPVLIAGNPVTWTYEVSNTGSRPISNVVVTDDQEGTVSCPLTVLDAGESMTCTAIVGTVQVGQYANVATVDALRQDASPISDTDPSHYFGQAAPAVTLEKETEGVDADLPPGPVLPVGDPVSWTYEVTNVGTDPLVNVTVTDDQGVAVSCPGTTLAAGESMICTAAGTVQVGQYANLGTVTAELPDASLTAASDPSHYFGQQLQLEKRTAGQDADLPPGPVLEAGDPVSWAYEVANPGPATVTGLAVTDDQGVTVSCPQTSLAAGESVVCTGSGTVQGGPYVNVGTASATLPLGGTVTASDPSHYFGTTVRLEKATNGQDADSPPGPVVAVGDPVSWTYEVTNLGSDTLTNVAVTDDQGVTVTCPGTLLDPGESMACTGNGSAAAGQYTNVGSVTADHPTFGEVAASDPSHYFGQDQVLDFGDAADPPYPTVLASNGARHLLGGGVFLGACVDAELDGQASADADGDDLGAALATFGTCAVAGDDEDGVAFDSPLVPGSTADVTVTASAPCTLSAWIDWNADGDWSDAGEDLFPGGTAIVAGGNASSVAVPSGAASGPTAARFRCTTGGAVTPVGEVADGEVEDYLVTVGAPEVSATKTVSLLVDQDGDGAAEAGDTLAYEVVIRNDGIGAAAGVVFTDSPDPNTALVVGSVTTTQGAVVSGNTPGDATVEADVGTIAAGAMVTIGYQVTIDNPLAPGVQQVVNQGSVEGDDFAPLPTDDPGAPGAEDPTVIALGTSLPFEIPTVGGAGLVVLLVLLAALAVRRLS
jgi:uncharacterized repeat protein (TIGR01451 family)